MKSIFSVKFPYQILLLGTSRNAMKHIITEGGHIWQFLDATIPKRFAKKSPDTKEDHSVLRLRVSGVFVLNPAEQKSDILSQVGEGTCP